MKVKYEGGQVLTDVMPDLKKTRFSFGAVLFFIFCATSGGAFGIESIIPASGPGMTLVLLVIIPLMWALPMGLYVSELTNLAPVDSGPYVWVKMAFGEFWGFAFGLWMAVAWYLTGASYIVLATDYIGMYINMSPMVELAVNTEPSLRSPMYWRVLSSLNMTTATLGEPGRGRTALVFVL